ncbi:DUF1302 family protein [Treponema sp.]|uniref:DUF1302 family protein n=1 Tax=Treponema sp. TaxID=166 RepID=UPI0025D72069|nr:DUF1302 family protein [Treponema sp.]MCR5218417.1 hypothetical protein [Treponema sp.]
MKKLCALIPAFFSAALFAQDFYPAGELKISAGAGAPETHDNAGKILNAATSLNGNLKIHGEETSAYIDGSLIYDGINARSSSGRFDFVSGDSSIELMLKEAWMDYDAGLFAIRIGRQITAWGKADGLEVTDILCPKDERTLSASNYSESRLGIDAARLSVKSDSLTADLYWIPLFTPSALPLADGNPLKALVIPQSISYGSYTLPVNEITSDNFDLPETALYNSEAAIRLSSYQSFGDFSLYAFYGFDREPVMNYSLKTDDSGKPESITLTGSYKRMTMFGADAAIPVKELVLRMEAAFFLDRYFTSDIKKNQIKALAGFDWMPSACTITAQYYIDALLNNNDQVERDDIQQQASLNLSKSFLQETLDLSFTGLLDLKDFASMLSLQASYSLSDSMTLSAESSFFIPGPDEDGLYGNYEDLSCLSLKASYSF